MRKFWVAEFVYHPAGPAFRGRCDIDNWRGPTHQVPANAVTAEVRDAAAAGYGPIAHKAIEAAFDLTQHLTKRHGFNPRHRMREGHKRLRFDIQEAT